MQRNVIMRWYATTLCLGLVITSCLYGAPQDRLGTIPPEPSEQPGEAIDSGPDCPSAEQRAKWFHSIGSIEAKIALGDRKVPADCSTNLFTTSSSGEMARHGSMTDFHWVAPEIWHQPVYFDDVPLEQNGQTLDPLLQPPISMARFFLTVPAMPYKMTLNRPFTCVTELGKYRPGSPAPCMRQLPPWDLRAAAVEGKAIAALILLFP